MKSRQKLWITQKRQCNVSVRMNESISTIIAHGPHTAHCAVLSTTRCLQCAAGGRGKCAQEVGWPKIGAWRRPRPRRNSRCVRTQDTGQRTDNIFRAACEHCSVFTFLRLQSARCYTTGKGSNCAGFEVCGQGIPWTLDSDR